jgi:hypothetical protein
VNYIIFDEDISTKEPVVPSQKKPKKSTEPLAPKPTETIGAKIGYAITLVGEIPSAPPMTAKPWAPIVSMEPATPSFEYFDKLLIPPNPQQQYVLKSLDDANKEIAKLKAELEQTRKIKNEFWTVLSEVAIALQTVPLKFAMLEAVSKERNRRRRAERHLVAREVGFNPFKNIYGLWWIPSPPIPTSNKSKAGTTKENKLLEIYYELKDSFGLHKGLDTRDAMLDAISLAMDKHGLMPKET